MKKAKEVLNRIIKDIKACGWALAAVMGYYLVMHLIFDAFCPLLAVTGIPCAGCGLTRAFLYLLTGQVSRAAYINPTVFAVLGFGLYCGFFRYVRGTKIRGLKITAGFLVAGMLLFYGYRMWLYFPDRVPYVYHSKNILADTLPGYLEWMQMLLYFRGQ